VLIFKKPDQTSTPNALRVKGNGGSILILSQLGGIASSYPSEVQGRAAAKNDFGDRIFLMYLNAV